MNNALTLTNPTNRVDDEGRDVIKMYAGTA